MKEVMLHSPHEFMGDLHSLQLRKSHTWIAGDSLRSFAAIKYSSIGHELQMPLA
jgi:hypothetical protein